MTPKRRKKYKPEQIVVKLNDAHAAVCQSLNPQDPLVQEIQAGRQGRHSLEQTCLNSRQAAHIGDGSACDNAGRSPSVVVAGHRRPKRKRPGRRRTARGTGPLLTEDPGGPNDLHNRSAKKTAATSTPADWNSVLDLYWVPFSQSALIPRKLAVAEMVLQSFARYSRMLVGLFFP